MRESRCLTGVSVWLGTGARPNDTAVKPHTLVPRDKSDHKLAEYKKNENRTQPFSLGVGNHRTRAVIARETTRSDKLMFQQNRSNRCCQTQHRAPWIGYNRGAELFRNRLVSALMQARSGVRYRIDGW